MFGSKLECFYNDGTNEHYVGYIRKLEGGFGGGFSVHFTEYEYPQPSGAADSIKRIKRQTHVPSDDDSVSSVKKKKPRSKFADWGRGYQRNKLGFCPKGMECEGKESEGEESEKEDEDEVEEDEDEESKKGSDEELMAQERMSRVIRKLKDEAYELQEKRL